MDTKKIIIAIDGYASTGKSSFADMIAEHMGYLHLDSGALYRAVTLYAINHDMIDERNHIDTDRLRDSLDDIKVSFRDTDGDSKFETFLGGRNVSKRIRRMDVSNSVSPIATLPFVRDFVDGELRKMGADGGVVMDGRDIGSKVFPNAQLKIFMTADIEIRARRRYDEMVASGKEVSLEEVVKNLSDRDYIDSHRAVSPLVQAEDAVVLDNSHMTLEDQMRWFDALMEERFGIRS